MITDCTEYNPVSYTHLDVYKRQSSALPLILQQIKNQGYEIVPVGKLIYPNSKLVDPSGMQLKP